MQFQVPQFLDIEDKIFGPFTFRQFVYIAGSAGLAFLLFHYIPTPFNMLASVAALGTGLSFAFVKIHKRPLIHFAEATFWYLMKSKLYIWKKRPAKSHADQQNKREKNNNTEVDIPKLSERKLRDLAWGLDINEKVAQARLQEQLEKSKSITDSESSFKF